MSVPICKSETSGRVPKDEKGVTEFEDDEVHYSGRRCEEVKKEFKRTTSSGAILSPSRLICADINRGIISPDFEAVPGLVNDCNATSAGFVPGRL